MFFDRFSEFALLEQPSCEALEEGQGQPSPTPVDIVLQVSLLTAAIRSNMNTSRRTIDNCMFCLPATDDTISATNAAKHCWVSSVPAQPYHTWCYMLACGMLLQYQLIATAMKVAAVISCEDSF